MNLVELTRKLVVSLVTDKDGVTVKEFETDDENFVQIEVLVSDLDMGRVIGKGGKTINAIKTIVQASAYLDHKKVKINVESL